MKFERKKRSEGDMEIPLTSATDMMFLLLIFFMVTTTFQASSGIQVNLPKSSAQMPEETIKRVVVSIKDDGRIFVENATVTEATLSETFALAAKNNPDALVVIRADKNVHHGTVVSVMDAARNAGLNKMAIATVQRGER